MEQSELNKISVERGGMEMEILKPSKRDGALWITCKYEGREMVVTLNAKQLAELLDTKGLLINKD